MSRATAKNRGEKGRSTPTQPPPATRNLDVVDIVTGRLTESEWLSMLFQSEGERYVADILDEFINRVLVKCYEAYLTKQLVPFSVACAKNATVQVIEWQYLTHDTGDGVNTVSLFQEDTEPSPMITDSWAQGCISVIRIPNILQSHIAEQEADMKDTQKQGYPSIKTELHLRKPKRDSKRSGRNVKLIPSHAELERNPNPPEIPLPTKLDYSKGHIVVSGHPT